MARTNTIEASARPTDAHPQSAFDDDEWLTIDQVASYLSCPPMRVREWIASGLLTAQPFGSIERIRKSELDAIGNPDDGAAAKFEQQNGT